MGGYSAVDNGYARFDHVRIPREQMLSGFASVTPDGQYVQPPHAKLSYGGVNISPCPLSQGTLVLTWPSIRCSLSGQSASLIFDVDTPLTDNVSAW